MPYNKICVICGKSFETDVHNKSVCSTHCQIMLQRAYNLKSYHKRAAAKKIRFKTCIVCGKSFEPVKGNQVICSDDCQAVRKKLASEKFRSKKDREKDRGKVSICCICGKKFTPAFNGEKYCSDSCRQDPRAKKLARFFTKAFQAIESGCYSFDFQDSIQTLVSL